MPYTASLSLADGKTACPSHTRLVSSVAQAFVQRSRVLLLQREGRREAGSLTCAFFLRFAWFLNFSWRPGSVKSVLGLCGRWPHQVCRPELVQTQIRIPSPLLFANCHGNLPATSLSALYKCPQMCISKLQRDRPSQSLQGSYTGHQGLRALAERTGGKA